MSYQLIDFKFNQVNCGFFGGEGGGGDYQMIVYSLLNVTGSRQW